MSAFAEGLAAGTLISAELTPPRDHQAAEVLEIAQTWEGCVDAVHINDCLLSTARMSNLAVAALIRQTSSLEPVLQVTLRHRNRIAVQADLLGAHALGVRGLVLLAGYDLSVGPDRRAREVLDLRSGEALTLTRRLSDTGVLFDGEQLDSPPCFSTGAVAFVSAGSAMSQIRQIEAKIERGAQWLQLQGTFDPEVALPWLDAMYAEGIHERVNLVGGVIPFASAERLRQLQAIPGISVPPSAFARMAGEDGAEAGFQFALELAVALMAHPATRGIHVRPFGWEAVVPRLAAAVRELVPAPAAA